MSNKSTILKRNSENQQNRPTSEELDVWEAVHKAAPKMGKQSPLTDQQKSFLYESRRIGQGVALNGEKEEEIKKSTTRPIQNQKNAEIVSPPPLGKIKILATE